MVRPGVSLVHRQVEVKQERAKSGDLARTNSLPRRREAGHDRAAPSPLESTKAHVEPDLLCRRMHTERRGTATSALVDL